MRLTILWNMRLKVWVFCSCEISLNLEKAKFLRRAFLCRFIYQALCYDLDKSYNISLFIRAWHGNYFMYFGKSPKSFGYDAPFSLTCFWPMFSFYLFRGYKWKHTKELFLAFWQNSWLAPKILFVIHYSQ